MQRILPKVRNTAEKLFAGDLFLLALVIIFTAVVVSSSFLFDSLWLDETISWWVIADGWHQTIRRALNFQAQSPLYFLLLRGWVALTSPTEFWMRIPSLLTVIAAAWTTYRIARYFFDSVSSAFAVVVFLASDEITRTISVRPYGLALVCVLLATLALLNWFRDRSLKYLLHYVALMTLALYFHYLFAAIMIVHMAFLMWKRGHDRTTPLLSVLTSFLIVALLAVPGILHLNHLMARVNVYFTTPPHALDLITVLLPPAILICTLLAGLFVLLFVKGCSWRCQSNKSLLLPLGLWYLAPVLFYSVARISQKDLYFERYFAWSVSGLALLAGFILSHIETRIHRTLIILIVVVGLADWKLATVWGFDEWEQVTRVERDFMSTRQVSDVPILVYTNVLEGEQIDWFNREPERGFLLAPFAYYPILGNPVLLPKSLESKDGQAYLNSVIAPLLTKHSDFVFICRRLAEAYKGDRLIPVDRYYEELFTHYGFKSKALAPTNIVKIIHYQRSAAL